MTNQNLECYNVKANKNLVNQLSISKRQGHECAMKYGFPSVLEAVRAKQATDSIARKSLKLLRRRAKGVPMAAMNDLASQICEPPRRK